MTLELSLAILIICGAWFFAHRYFSWRKHQMILRKKYTMKFFSLAKQLVDENELTEHQYDRLIWLADQIDNENGIEIVINAMKWIRKGGNISVNSGIDLALPPEAEDILLDAYWNWMRALSLVRPWKKFKFMLELMRLDSIKLDKQLDTSIMNTHFKRHVAA